LCVKKHIFLTSETKNKKISNIKTYKLNKHIIIHNSIPPYLSDSEIKLFKPYSVSKIRIPKIRKIKNVFVTHQGLVLQNGFLVNGCALNLRGKEDNTFYYTFWRDTIEKYAVCRWGKSLQSIHLKGSQQYLLIHSKWFNYAFWINSYLVRLMMAKDYFNNVKLLVPEGWEKISYVWDSLDAFNIEYEIIPNGYQVFVDNLLMPETRQWTASFYPPHIQLTSEYLIEEAKKRVAPDQKFPKRIYLTRAKRNVRCVENEEEVIEFLKLYGFSAITFEDLSIWEQIVMMHDATHFISIHGAGFSNVMFMKPNSIAIEFIEYDFAHYANPFPHWKLCNSNNIQYIPLIMSGRNTTFIKKTTINKTQYNDRMNLVNNNIFVNISTLKKITDKIFIQLKKI